MTLNRDAKMLRDRYGVAYVVALKLVRTIGLEAATARCAEGDLKRQAPEFSLVVCTCLGACDCGLGPVAATEPSTACTCASITYGLCDACGRIHDMTAWSDYFTGPRMLVDLLPAMVTLINVAQFVGPWTTHATHVVVTGRRYDLERLRSAFAEYARSDENVGAGEKRRALALHAVARLDAALKGAKGP